MESNYINESKTNYADKLIANGNTARANEIMQGETK